jgi:hypothetical protein
MSNIMSPASRACILIGLMLIINFGGASEAMDVWLRAVVGATLALLIADAVGSWLAEQPPRKGLKRNAPRP